MLLFILVLLSKRPLCLIDVRIFLQIAFTSLVYPALVLAYMGQAAYISSHHTVGSNPKIGFYVSVPGKHLEFFFFSRKFLDLKNMQLLS